MDLKELRYFRTIVQCGTFSKAAAHLRIAQPALSRQMQKLEHSLGVELLRRTSRGVTPTEAGQALLHRTIQFEQEIDETRREVAKYADRPTGAMRVAVQMPLSLIMMPELVKAYRTSFPDVVLELTEGFSGDLIDGLLDRRLDAAIVDAPSHLHADLTCSPLWVETLQLVCPAAGAAAEQFGAGPVPLAELAKLPIIMPSRKYAIRRLVDAAFERHRLKFRPIFEANGSFMIFELVKSGFGCTLMPSSGSYPWIVNGELRALDVRPAIRRTINLVTRTALLHERPIVSFRTIVEAIAPRIAGSKRLAHAALYPSGPGGGKAGAGRERTRQTTSLAAPLGSHSRAMPERHGAGSDKALEAPLPRT